MTDRPAPVHNVVEDLLPLLVPIEQLSEHPENARQGDVEIVRESLREHGQYRPAVVQESTGHVCVGNHMLRAAQLEGWTHLAAIRRPLTDHQARRLRLVDNRSHDRGHYDAEKLLAELQALQDEAAIEAEATDPQDAQAVAAGALAAVGFDQLAFDGLLEQVSGQPRGDGATSPQAFPDPEAGMTTDYGCPNCGYEWSGLPKPNQPAPEPAEA